MNFADIIYLFITLHTTGDPFARALFFFSKTFPFVLRLLFSARPPAIRVRRARHTAEDDDGRFPRIFAGSFRVAPAAPAAADGCLRRRVPGRGTTRRGRRRRGPDESFAAHRGPMPRRMSAQGNTPSLLFCQI